MNKKFNPDWASPPSDTIKDILEERGDSYEDFIQFILTTTDFFYTFEHIQNIFEGKLEMPPSIAQYLTLYLGGSTESWINRSRQYRTKVKLLNDDALERVLYNCLSAQLKREDAPCSSETHLNTAISQLYDLVGEFTPINDEYKFVLEEALKEMAILRGDQNE